MLTAHIFYLVITLWPFFFLTITSSCLHFLPYPLELTWSITVIILLQMPSSSQFLVLTPWISISNPQLCIKVTICILPFYPLDAEHWWEKWHNWVDWCHSKFMLSKFIGPYCQSKYSTLYSGQAIFLIAIPILLADKLADFSERKLKLSDKHLKTLLSNCKLKYLHLNPNLIPGIE